MILFPCSQPTLKLMVPMWSTSGQWSELAEAVSEILGKTVAFMLKEKRRIWCDPSPFPYLELKCDV